MIEAEIQPTNLGIMTNTDDKTHNNSNNQGIADDKPKYIPPSIEFPPLSEEWGEYTDVTAQRLVNDGVLSEKRTKDFKKFMYRRQIVGKTFDRFLIFQAYYIEKQLKKKNDFVVMIVGREGIGKSTVGIQLGAWINPYFSLNEVCLTSKQIIRNFRVLPEGSVLQIDEGSLSLFSRDAMMSITKSIIKIFNIIRMKRLCTICIIPDFKSIDRYIREERVHLLIDVRARGDYVAIDEDGIKFVNDQIKKKKKISACKIPGNSFYSGDFYKQFPNTICINDYERMKARNIDIVLRDMERESEGVSGISRFKMIQAHQWARQNNIKLKSLYTQIQKGTIKASKIGKQWFIPFQEAEHLTQHGNIDRYKHQ